MEKTDLIHCALGITISVLLRVTMSLHPYSGQGKPPIYGDFEAQRHWMEITINLPVKEWYFNTTNNDLMYWGLDYPPLTAYHSFLCGLIGKFLNPQYTELYKSRGFESEPHKLFMRYTVLLSDLLIYIPSIIYYFWVIKKISGKISFKYNLIISLLYPGIILIDHGHFQYNCISLGLAIFAISFLEQRKFLLSSFFFCLALNFKQMELYHAFPFFLYLLSSCIPNPNQNVPSSIFKLIKISLVVILTFFVIWSPFVFSLKNIFQVIHRLFPVARGVFEDKVSNVWCVLNIFYKLKRICPLEMLRYCTLTTLVSILPSSIDLFIRPNIRKFIPSLINSSLAFFLFSFQVHEKTILLPAIPVLLHFPFSPIASFWFLTISVFSMFPLLTKDNLVIATFALTIFYGVSFKLIYEKTHKINLLKDFRGFLKDFLDIFERNSFLTTLKKHKVFLKNFSLLCLLTISIIFMVLLCLTSLIFKPPKKYPDLFPLLISVYSCLHFLGFFVYFNYLQLKIPQNFDYLDVKIKKS